MTFFRSMRNTERGVTHYTNCFVISHENIGFASETVDGVLHLRAEKLSFFLDSYCILEHLLLVNIRLLFAYYNILQNIASNQPNQMQKCEQ